MLQSNLTDIHPKKLTCRLTSGYCESSRVISQSTTHIIQGNFLTCLLGGQGKHVWLIVRQLPVKAGWWDAPLTLWDLAKTICLNKARSTKDAFSASPKQDLQPHATTIHPPTIKSLQTTKITELGLLPLPIGF